MMFLDLMQMTNAHGYSTPCVCHQMLTMMQLAQA